jgi:hypothetical protein
VFCSSFAGFRCRFDRTPRHNTSNWVPVGHGWVPSPAQQYIHEFSSFYIAYFNICNFTAQNGKGAEVFGVCKIERELPVGSSEPGRCLYPLSYISIHTGNLLRACVLRFVAALWLNFALQNNSTLRRGSTSGQESPGDLPLCIAPHRIKIQWVQNHLALLKLLFFTTFSSRPRLAMQLSSNAVTTAWWP